MDGPGIYVMGLGLGAKTLPYRLLVPLMDEGFLLPETKGIPLEEWNVDASSLC